MKFMHGLGAKFPGSIPYGLGAVPLRTYSGVCVLPSSFPIFGISDLGGFYIAKSGVLLPIFFCMYYYYPTYGVVILAACDNYFTFICI